MFSLIVTLASNIRKVKYKNCGRLRHYLTQKTVNFSFILYNNYEQIAGTI